MKRQGGMRKSSHSTISNCKSRFESVEEEGRIRNEVVAENMSIFRSKLPILLKRMAKIEDPRNPKKTKHKLSTLMIYGILTFVFQIASCRQANKDGLYANGPVAEICRKNKWQFMIVLKDDALPSVMNEFEALSAIEKQKPYRYTWGNRKQAFRWINGIDYRFGPNDKKRQILHVVECKESWKEVDRESGKPEEKNSRHVWLSSEPLNRFNFHERCNLAARSRWCIESNILVEKHHGYKYEHCFSYDWNVMKG